MDFLRDPALSGIGSIATVLAVLLYLYAEREKFFGHRTRRTIYYLSICVLIGIVMGILIHGLEYLTSLVYSIVFGARLPLAIQALISLVFAVSALYLLFNRILVPAALWLSARTEDWPSGRGASVLFVMVFILGIFAVRFAILMLQRP